MGIDSERFERPNMCIVCGGIFEHVDGCKKAEQLGLPTHPHVATLEARIAVLETALTVYIDFVKAISWRKVYMGSAVMRGEVSYDLETFERVWLELDEARAVLEESKPCVTPRK